MPPRKDEKLAAEYEQEVGHPPRNLPDDHPDKWQWEYTGTKAEREELRERLGLPEEPPAVVEGQEELFS